MHLLRALIFSTSSMWFNYRHAANAFAFAKMLETNGIGRRSILLGVGSDPAFDVRNPIPGSVFHDRPLTNDVHYFANFEGDDVSITTFRSLLLRGPIRGRASEYRIHQRPILFLTGHGGEEFLKFRNTEELRALEFAEMIEHMKQINPFEELLIILDTCQADTFFRYIDTDGVITLASSILGEYARSEIYDEVLGVPICDLFSRELVKLVPQLGPNSTLIDLRDAFNAKSIGSTVVLRSIRTNRSLAQIRLGEFFW